jgi:hypothetical protein
MKKGLLRKLSPIYVTLACRGAPSRLVESLFVSGDIEDKEVVAEALAGSLQSLQVYPFIHTFPPSYKFMLLTHQ